MKNNTTRMIVIGLIISLLQCQSINLAPGAVVNQTVTANPNVSVPVPLNTSGVNATNLTLVNTTIVNATLSANATSATCNVVDPTIYLNGNYTKTAPSFIPQISQIPSTNTCFDKFRNIIGYLNDYEQAALVNAALCNNNTDRCFDCDTYSRYIVVAVTNEVKNIANQVGVTSQKDRAPLSCLYSVAQAHNFDSNTNQNITGQLLTYLTYNSRSNQCMAKFLVDNGNILLNRRRFFCTTLANQAAMGIVDSAGRYISFRWNYDEARSVTNSMLNLISCNAVKEFLLPQVVVDVIETMANTTQCGIQRNVTNVTTITQVTNATAIPTVSTTNQTLNVSTGPVPSSRRLFINNDVESDAILSSMRTLQAAPQNNTNGSNATIVLTDANNTGSAIVGDKNITANGNGTNGGNITVETSNVTGANSSNSSNNNASGSNSTPNNSNGTNTTLIVNDTTPVASATVGDQNITASANGTNNLTVASSNATNSSQNGTSINNTTPLNGNATNSSANSSAIVPTVLPGNTSSPNLTNATNQNTTVINSAIPANTTSLKNDSSNTTVLNTTTPNTTVVNTTAANTTVLNNTVPNTTVLQNNTPNTTVENTTVLNNTITAPPNASNTTVLNTTVINNVIPLNSTPATPNNTIINNTLINATTPNMNNTVNVTAPVVNATPIINSTPSNISVSNVTVLNSTNIPAGNINSTTQNGDIIQTNYTVPNTPNGASVIYNTTTGYSYVNTVGLDNRAFAGAVNVSVLAKGKGQAIYDHLGDAINATLLKTNIYNYNCLPEGAVIFLSNLQGSADVIGNFSNTNETCTQDYVIEITGNTTNCDNCNRSQLLQNFTYINPNFVPKSYYLASGCLGSNRFIYGNWIDQNNTLWQVYQHNEHDWNSMCMNRMVNCAGNNGTGDMCPKSRLNTECASSLTSMCSNSGLFNNIDNLKIATRQYISIYPPACDYITQGLNPNNTNFIENCFSYIAGNFFQSSLNYNNRNVNTLGNSVFDYNFTNSTTLLRFLQASNGQSVQFTSNDPTLSDTVSNGIRNYTIDSSQIVVDSATINSTPDNVILSQQINNITAPNTTTATGSGITNTGASYLNFTAIVFVIYALLF